MQINNISNNSFDGKFIIPKPLSKKEKEFAEKLMNYEINGVTNAKYLSGKNFDVNIYAPSKKKRIPNKLSFIIGLKHIGTEKNDRGVGITTLTKQVICLDDGIPNAANNLRSYIDRTDSYLDDNLPTQYNTNFQKFLIKVAMFLRIL